MTAKVAFAMVGPALILAATLGTPVAAQSPTDSNPCALENLVNGFLPVQSGSSGPKCSVRTTSTAPPVVYRLRFASRFQETISVDHVTYDVTRQNPTGTNTAISIRLSRSHNVPRVFSLRDPSLAQPANFLPRPGVFVHSGPDLIVVEWVEPAGLYELSIDPKLTDLSIEQVAHRLVAEESDELGPYPAGTLTGVRRVDAAIEAALSGNGTALVELLQFVNRPCMFSAGPGKTLCPEGAKEGDVVPAVELGACEGGGRTEIPEEFLAEFLEPSRFLYAVARTPSPHLEFLVIFAENQYGARSSALGIGSTGVTTVLLPCRQSAPRRAESRDEFLLPIRLGGEPGPPATGSGLRAQENQPAPFSLLAPLLATAVALSLIAIGATTRGRAR